MSDNGGWSDPSRQGDQQKPSPGWQAPPPSFPQAPGYGSPRGYGKPGVIPLRPLSVGEILDGAINTMRRHPGLTFGVSAIVAVIEAALSLGASIWLLSEMGPIPPQPGPAATPQEALDYASAVLGQTAATLGVTLVITVLIRTFLTGFMTVVVGKAVLGKPITFGEALGELAPRLPALLGVTVLYTLMVAVGSVFFLVPGIWLYALFSLASPALVLEHGRVGQALNRSRLLVQGSWWRVFGVLLLTGVCATVIAFVIQIPFNLSAGVGGADMAELGSASIGVQLLSSAGQVVAQTLVAPFVAGATALLYIDQRMRKEGMDIQLARAAGAV
ncbi:hypothetical protein [Amycolatopsis taiwanensis]|uniref:Membrane protein n=1 Tax=Amycolatopsis taiwanensis TaxID=342230 RepID=A0A9W6R4L7_9PSEU|nr:hypothetical protein [Amycolatopsis taiwanensis]GLY68250.1 membrane protein [Amycolatopsis taiwanensis]